MYLLVFHYALVFLNLPCLHIDLSFIFQQNKQILIDAVVHAVNEDYVEMANDFTRLGFLAPGTDVSPIVPALESIWQNSVGKGLSDFNFRSVTGNFMSYNFDSYSCFSFFSVEVCACVSVCRYDMHIILRLNYTLFRYDLVACKVF